MAICYNSETMIRRIPTPVRVLLAADFTLAALHLLTLLDRTAPIPKWIMFFNMDKEPSLPTWYSSTQLFLVALVFGLHAIGIGRQRLSRVPTILWAFPLLFMALSIDEISQVHEWIGGVLRQLLPATSREGSIFSRTGIWMFLLAPPLAALIGFVIFRAREYFLQTRGVIPRIITGTTIFLAGAAGVELLGNVVELRSVAHIMEVLVEELLEMVGVTLIFWAGWDLLPAGGLSLPADRSNSQTVGSRPDSP